MLAELQNISKSYLRTGSDTGNRVLDGISLIVGEKETLAITGPSGSGKSTLLNILGTLDRPDSGSVILDGIRVEELNESQLARHRNRSIGFVFQMHHLLPQLSLIENVLLPVIPLKDSKKQTNARDHAIHLIDRLGLTNKKNHRPWQLSAGECQRAAVARALVNRPRILLADEPTGALDAENADRLGQLLAELNREHDLAVVVVTHSPELAAKMGTIYRLSSGNLQQVKKP